MYTMAEYIMNNNKLNNDEKIEQIVSTVGRLSEQLASAKIREDSEAVKELRYLIEEYIDAWQQLRGVK